MPEMKTLISFRTLWLVSVICFFSVTSSPARAGESGVISKIIQADGFQLEAFVFGDGPVSLIMAAGNGRPAAQLDDLAKAISTNGIKVVTYNGSAPRLFPHFACWPPVCTRQPGRFPSP
jgi:hypothetical protein